MSLPRVVSRDEWLAARKELLVKEKELTRRRDALNAERRLLPMVRIDKDYVFEGPSGPLGGVPGPDGAASLLYYNEPAEALLGHSFEETGEMPVEEWGTIFRPVDADARPIPPERLPLVVALAESRPTHGELTIVGLDGVSRHLEMVAFPLDGQHGARLGGVALFWEAPP